MVDEDSHHRAYKGNTGEKRDLLLGFPCVLFSPVVIRFLAIGFPLSALDS
jgi:hypothetical protein